MNLEEASYKELQKIAKELNIPANGKKEALILRIQAEMNQKKVEKKEQEQAQEEVVVVAAVEPEVETQELESQIETKEVESQKEAAPVEIKEVQEIQEVEKVEAEEEDIPQTTEEMMSEIDDGEAFEEEEEENIDPIENRVGGKLLGIATPTGQKKLFNSPALSKSGQKLYEKYNVCWRYEDYDNNELSSESLVTPQKQPIPTEMTETFPERSPDYFDADQAVDQEDDEDDPAERIGTKKLVGIPTPKGKSLLINTPTDKQCDKYAVHWRYEDYDSSESLPPAPPLNTTSVSHSKPLSKKQTSSRTTTPRSTGKFKYVHAHP